MNLGEKILNFLASLNIPVALPDEITVMNPFLDTPTMDICKQFYQKFYGDMNKRWMILGINPGRFGGGITGIPFTDPVRLHHDAGIENAWLKKQELSSVFIYEMIRAYGGAQAFYNNFYFSSVSPLGFTKNHKNLNYYDDKILQSAIKNFIVDCLKQQLDFGIHRNAAFCLGEGKNFSYLYKLNEELKIFDTIIPLSNPRFIMQYRLKRKNEFINYYIKQFQLFC